MNYDCHEYQQKQILSRLSIGLPVCEHPYAELAMDYGVDEAELIEFLKQSLANQKLKRIGAVVNHHKLGYSSNAMVVWNVPDNIVDEIGELLGLSVQSYALLSKTQKAA